MSNCRTMFSQLREFGEFLHRLKYRARFGDLSRVPLRVLRVQVLGERAECDWVARSADPWDSNLPKAVGEQNASIQALKDAIDARTLLFRILPELRSAVLRVYRESSDDALELIIDGLVTRDEQLPKAVRSLTMRAKLLGLRFWIDEGVLETLEPESGAATL